MEERPVGNYLETYVEAALKKAGIRYMVEGKNIPLDFYLPDHNTYIEVKQFHTDRVNQQLAKHSNVILLQGANAVKVFCELITNTNQ